MVIRNPHLKDMIKTSTNKPLEHKGYSFDYWSKQAKKPGLSKKQKAARWLRRAMAIGVLLAAFIVISVIALREQEKDMASLDCSGAGQKSSNSLLAFGSCKKR